MRIEAAPIALPRAPLVPQLARLRRLPAVVALVLLLGACADKSGVGPQARMREAASLGLGVGAQLEVPQDWWRSFGDAQLDRLIEQALADNPGLRLAQTRLARARAATELVAASNRIQVNGALDVTRQRYTANGAVPATLAGSTRDLATLQLSTGMEFDFFDRNRLALNAALGSANASQAEAQAARVLLAAQVAHSWFALARLQAQLDVAQRTLALREQTLDLVRQRVDAGLDTRLELQRGEGALPETRQLIEALREQMAVTRNALGALVGHPSAALALTPPALSAIRGAAPAGAIPADLLGRRADVAAARWRVQAALQEVDYARTQFYPSVNLIAFAGLSSIGLGRLIDSGSQQWGVGPAVRLPIFDGGRLRANLRVKATEVDAAIESYNAAIVDAVRDAADQLVSAQSIARQQVEQRASQAAAEGVYDIARQRYQAGLGNFLQVLDAETQVLAQRRQAVDLAARALDTQVALMRALGGGYTDDAPPLTPRIAQQVH
ncbi:MAG: efflux transporter outer membrane subunit [Burkholderiaceae bacterium]|nr:efflux transporter outer membrane subunit [Burkholderiaceae bacterium]